LEVKCATTIRSAVQEREQCPETPIEHLREARDVLAHLEAALNHVTSAKERLIYTGESPDTTLMLKLRQAATSISAPLGYVRTKTRLLEESIIGRGEPK
jgi:hypothetical protein